MTIASEASLTVGHGGATTTRRSIESITALKVDGVRRPIPRPISVIRDHDSWILDDPQALAYGAADTYPDALEEYLLALVWLRDELADSDHPANRAQRLAALEILEAVGR